MDYEASETPIKDRSMLGTRGQKLCDNIDVYWLTPGKTMHVLQCALNLYLIGLQEKLCSIEHGVNPK